MKQINTILYLVYNFEQKRIKFTTARVPRRKHTKCLYLFFRQSYCVHIFVPVFLFVCVYLFLCTYFGVCECVCVCMCVHVCNCVYIMGCVSVWIIDYTFQTTTSIIFLVCCIFMYMFKTKILLNYDK